MILGTKADTLINSTNKIKEFLIPKSYVFTVNNWINNSKLIEKNIRSKFKKKKIILRSSTTFEDTNSLSAAGAFDSILNVNSSNEKEVKRSIEKVITSYKKKIKNISNQQILVQEMMLGIKMSGVIFTGDNSGYNNYYTINYDDVTGRTDTVTSGNSVYSNKTLYVYKTKKKFLRSFRFKKLIKATKEIENYFSFPLDIEFCMNKKNKLYLFQIRPVVLKKNSEKKFNKKNFDKRLEFEFNNIKNSFIKKNSSLFGTTTIFSQMSDWNPAEMIGQFPSKLSYSLYSKLITDKCWLIARKKMGYKFFNDCSLMKSFAGRPYIDVRKSLNSLLPKNLNKSSSKELVDKSILKLKINPSSHDKIEFDLFPTCFSFQIKKRLIDLGYKKNLHDIEDKLLQIFLTNLKNNSSGSLKYNLNKIEILNKKQKKNFYNKKFNVLSIKEIIKDLKKYGIIPFSILARHGFIARDLLISLKKIGVLSESDIENFMRSFSTITTEFLNDQIFLKKKQISYKDFINKYGHLRAGTYDIKSNNYYKMNKKVLLNDSTNSILKHKKFKLPLQKKKQNSKITF